MYEMNEFICFDFKEKFKSEDKKCLFCSQSERDVLKFGQMYKLNHIYVHYYCLVLSSLYIKHTII